MCRSSRWKVIGTLTILAIAVAGPVFISGLRSAELASSESRAGRHATAAQSYADAARKLPWRDDLWEQAGISAYAAGDAVSAIRLLRVGEQKQALSVRGWDFLGSSLWSIGNAGDAISAWQKGSALNPADANLLDHLAGAFHELGEYDAEQAALERRLQLADDAGALYRLGLLLMLSDADGAADAIRSAVTLNAEIGPAAATLQAAMRAASLESNPAQRFVLLGRSLGLVEEWGLAARAFERAAEADATDAQARAWLGEARQHMGQDGRLDLDAAMKLGPQESVVHTLRGLYWRRQGNSALSFAEYSRAVQLEPGNPALQSLLGEAYAFGGDLVAALEAYQNAAELAPSESTYWRLLALFCADNDVRVLDIGLAAALKAVELAPKDPQALDALGWTYAQAGYLTKSEQVLLQAIDAAPNLASPRLHLGLTYIRWGQNNQAYEQWNTAAQLDGNGATGQLAAQLLRTFFPTP